LPSCYSLLSVPGQLVTYGTVRFRAAYPEGCALVCLGGFRLREYLAIREPNNAPFWVATGACDCKIEMAMRAIFAPMFARFEFRFEFILRLWKNRFSLHSAYSSAIC
jgi:hypothetical protein